MSKRTYEIKPRHQYDPDGARVEFGALRTAYSIEDGKLVMVAGDMPRITDLAEVKAAVLRVMASKEAETLILGEDDPVVAAKPEWKSDRGYTLTEEMDAEDSDF